jgi:nitroimidazol reductase NimA-like FMN-containing flavoprotein (pyridoxamine 5'-phosphate oxidase superfamily)
MHGTKELIRSLLPQAKIMQLATSHDDQPWVCTVHYSSDDQLNLYWVSKPDREHSKHIAANPKTAATILIHENTLDEDYVIAVTLEGESELLNDIPEEVGQNYTVKHAKDPNLPADIASGSNPQKFYRLKPAKIVLFDTKDFPESPRQELHTDS